VWVSVSVSVCGCARARVRLRVMYKPAQRGGESPSWAFVPKRKDCDRTN